MTVIAALKTDLGIHFAADSILSAGSMPIPAQSVKTEKLAEVNEMVLGSTGDASAGQMMRIFMRSHRPEAPTVDKVIDFALEFDEWCKAKDRSFENANTFLLGFDGELFVIHPHSFAVFKVEEYWAIGAGADMAIAAMALGKPPREAVELACKLSVWCQEPVTGISLLTAPKGE